MNALYVKAVSDVVVTIIPMAGGGNPLTILITQKESVVTEFPRVWRHENFVSPPYTPITHISVLCSSAFPVLCSSAFPFIHHVAYLLLL